MRFIIAAIFLIPSIGFMAFVFLLGLDWVTHLRLSDSRFFLAAPFVGLLTGWLYTRVSRESAPGNQLLIGELVSLGEEKPKEKIPALMAPLIILSTWLSHLAGLSVGREGTAVQAGGGIASTLAHWLGLRKAKQVRLLIRAGVAGGFAAVFGTPLAGFVFSYEVILKRQMNMSRLENLTQDGIRSHVYVLLSAFLSDQFARKLGAFHSSFQEPSYQELLSEKGIFALLLAGLLFGFLAWVFLQALEFFRKIFSKLVPDTMFRPFVAGFLFMPMAFLSHDWQKYAGLGVGFIQKSFQETVGFQDAVFKLALTVFSVGSGFRGGEVTPLFFIGSTAGSALAGSLELSPAVLASLGLCAVFGAAAGVPVACAVMAAELFGPTAILVALPTCMLASSVCRRARLYDE